MTKTDKVSKKAARKKMEKKLEATLGSLESIFGNKDFKKRVKRAGKTFVKGLKMKESQLTLASLKQIDVSKLRNQAHKKSGMKNNSPQTVIPHKPKLAEPHHN